MRPKPPDSAIGKGLANLRASEFDDTPFGGWAGEFAAGRPEPAPPPPQPLTIEPWPEDERRAKAESADPPPARTIGQSCRDRR